MKPILRWVGSKRAQAAELAQEIFPVLSFVGGRYFEPFLGSASVALALIELGAPASSFFLSDGLDTLIECYQALQAYPKATIEAFAEFAERSKTAKRGLLFASLRAEINQARRQGSIVPRPRLAAAFIYFNLRGFNGLIRQNKRGDFNVSIGKSSNGRPLKLPAKGELLSFSHAIYGAQIERLDFEASIERAKKGDLIYCDPPYDGTFTAYSTDWLSSDQERLARALERAVGRGCFVFASNADTPRVRALYGHFCEIRERSIRWQVGGHAERRSQAKEVLLIGRPNAVS